jgi:hypothetical protein
MIEIATYGQNKNKIPERNQTFYSNVHPASQGNKIKSIN